jgi:hypothetical protein
MKKKLLVILFALISYQTYSQTSNVLHGIVRKNYYSTAYDPFDSTITFQQFDSCTIRLGYTDPSVGFIYNTGSFTYNQTINLTGAALNPYNNTYMSMGAVNLNTFDLNTGAIINQVQTYNPIAPSYFDNFRFNQSDSNLYGLARRNYYDPITMQTIGEVYLAKANTQTGLITQISPTSVGYGFALAGSAIDPYQMVYYYSTGANLVGLDLYTGAIYSSVSIQIPNGIAFDNFTYSCVDTALYGLIRQNYFSYIYNPLSPLDSIQVLDSATVQLGRINPNTGIVKAISPYSIINGGYSLNAGAAIDPNNKIYYFNNGANLIGVSMVTGAIVSSNALTFADGEFFEMMRNTENCYAANPVRLNFAANLNNRLSSKNAINCYPNPVENQLNINSNVNISNIRIYDITGKLVLEKTNPNNNPSINTEGLTSGLYLVRLTTEDQQVLVQKMVKK